MNIRYGAADIGWGLHRLSVETAAPEADVERLAKQLESVFSFEVYRVRLSQDMLLRPLGHSVEGTSCRLFMFGSVRELRPIPGLDVPDAIGHRVQSASSIAAVPVTRCEVESRRVLAPDTYLQERPAIEVSGDSLISKVRCRTAVSRRVAAGLLEICGQICREFAQGGSVRWDERTWSRWKDERQIELPYPMSAGDLQRSLAIWLQYWWQDQLVLSLEP